MSTARYWVQYRLLGPVLYRRRRKAAREARAAYVDVGGHIVPQVYLDDAWSRLGVPQAAAPPPDSTLPIGAA